MQKVQRKQKNEDAKKVVMLVEKLNQYRHEYYNKAKPSVPDAVYDHLFDELQKMEKKTGIILRNSPTQTVGYTPVNALEKVRHPIPLLSLDKTKQTEELLQMAAKAPAMLMLKLDGLTIKLVYENGQLVEASTRGDGDIGEVITHNIPAFYNVSTKIPHKGRLVLTGEGFIHKEACNARNLASGSIRLLNPAVCKERHVYFYAFNILEGMEDFGKIADSRGRLLEAAGTFGFAVCPFTFLPEKVTLREIEDRIGCLKAFAEDSQIPIDGMVLRYDSLSYSKGCGRTGHHYKDGIAFKFEDDTYETVFRSIELLLKNDFNPKAVSKLMGHAKEIITMDVYGDNQGIIADCVPEIADFMDDVLPEQKADDKFKEELLDIVADTSEYLVEAS